VTFPEAIGPFHLHAVRVGEHDPEYVIALGQVALPGCYATREAALVAGGIVLADRGRGRLLLLAVRDAHPGKALTVEQLAKAADMLESTDVAGKIRAGLAETARSRAAEIAGKPGDPPDPKFPPRIEARLGIAEGWYQAADWLAPREAQR
jgi:hypothetical protein